MTPERYEAIRLNLDRLKTKFRGTVPYTKDLQDLFEEVHALNNKVSLRDRFIQEQADVIISLTSYTERLQRVVKDPVPLDIHS